MLIDLIAGARPNFIKISPIIDNLKNYNSLQYRLIHTGQHFDSKMSQAFFDDLGIPQPSVNFNAGGGTQAEQTAKIMTAYESLLLNVRSDLCVVVGDVTSTMACSIVAKKMLVPVAHIEAGIRSWDLTMPEEINRIVTDSIADYFFTTSRLANQNLLNIGVPEEKIYFVGNVMIDTLIKQMNKLKIPNICNSEKLATKNYIVLTLHRPSNVDKTEDLLNILDEIVSSSRNMPIVFPVHPRTAKILGDLIKQYNSIIFTEPLSYLEFIYLVKNSFAVITDSGGLSEETTVLNIPCLTLRNNTERPETVEQGTNILIGTSPCNIRKYMDLLFSNKWKAGKSPELWDGKSAIRIVDHLIEIFSVPITQTQNIN